MDVGFGLARLGQMAMVSSGLVEEKEGSLGLTLCPMSVSMDSFQQERCLTTSVGLDAASIQPIFVL